VRSPPGSLAFFVLSAGAWSLTFGALVIAVASRSQRQAVFQTISLYMIRTVHSPGQHGHDRRAHRRFMWEVPVQHAGSGSGLINAVGQVGGAVGVAVIGVIFFGYLASNADISSASVRDELVADLNAAGVGQPVQGFVVSGFQTCFRDRSKAKDPSEVPSSCAPPAGFSIPPAVESALAVRGKEANQRNFTTAFVRTLWYEIAALLFVCLLTFLLPRYARPQDVPLAA
jgi:hypothetical protein